METFAAIASAGNRKEGRKPRAARCKIRPTIARYTSKKEAELARCLDGIALCPAVLTRSQRQTLPLHAGK
eukprot:scaffold698_cov333-Pavlova_lutheri.AAC.7